MLICNYKHNSELLTNSKQFWVEISYGCLCVSANPQRLIKKVKSYTTSGENIKQAVKRSPTSSSDFNKGYHLWESFAMYFFVLSLSATNKEAVAQSSPVI